ncbi:hypothetical protein ACH5RR_032620 [Cinchona calisaya]|uniref:MULE transposase domain-containing protein n=1 Tax=Cinchona calisaya TaxID=153742 RepID=A0ABD2YIM8_9GENT
MDSKGKDKIFDLDKDIIFDENSLSTDDEDGEAVHIMKKIKNVKRLYHEADSRSRHDYNKFSNVLALDTTYRTNYNHKLLLVFACVNNHYYGIVFRCALMAHEDIETYDWVLGTFLEAMTNKKPMLVMTDGDRAMRKWTRQTKKTRSLHENACEGSIYGDLSKMERYGTLMGGCKQMCYYAINHEKGFHRVREVIHNETSIGRQKCMNIRLKCGEYGKNGKDGGTHVSRFGVLDLKQACTKGDHKGGQKEVIRKHGGYE